jgi:hypothetical protein
LGQDVLQHNNEFEIEYNADVIKILDKPLGGEESTVLAWFTVESLLWSRWRGRIGIGGFDNYRDLTSFDLLYVGIAAKTDCYTRLIQNGHKARTNILSSEDPREPGAKVAEEVFLFLFNVESLAINIEIPGQGFQNGGLDSKKECILKDAEKAYVSLLKPGYNTVQFNQYPKGKDGLYGSHFARYGYVIGEDISFNTAQGKKIKGKYEYLFNYGGDLIFVENDTVEVFHY